jgi:substrate import-associated zinc metallohydrolase lipoprotein
MNTIMNFIKISFLFFALGMLASCDKKEDLNVDDISGLGGDSWVNGPVDTWINNNLTTPYNIAVKYKWDQFELELNKTLVPPREDKVIPVMQTLKTGLIAPYTAEAGETFFKKYTPKFFVLVGSWNFNTDGTVTEGTAEGGRKVILYNINNFRVKGMAGYNAASDSNVVKRMFHVINHEFGHILHNNVMYPEDYKRITVGLYSSANWYNISDAEARREGFITNYSMNGPDDDFVEMISVMLTEGEEGFDRILAGITGNSMNGTSPVVARARLREKEAMIVNYFKEARNIDFY